MSQFDQQHAQQKEAQKKEQDATLGGSLEDKASAREQSSEIRDAIQARKEPKLSSARFQGIPLLEQVFAGRAFVRAGCTDEAAVTAIQEALTAAGFDTKKQDGTWGKDSKNAAKAFQKSKRLFSDGVITASTLKALDAVDAGVEAADAPAPARSETEEKKPQVTAEPEEQTPPANPPLAPEPQPKSRKEPPPKAPEPQPKSSAAGSHQETPKDEKPTMDPSAQEGAQELKTEGAVAARVGSVTSMLLNSKTPAAKVKDLLQELVSLLGVPENMQAPLGGEDALAPVAGTGPATLFRISGFIKQCQQSHQANSPDQKKNDAINTRLSRLATFYDHLAGSEGPVNPLGASVASIALSEVGKVTAQGYGGNDPKTGRAQRKGWEHLMEIFEVAYEGNLSPGQRYAIQYRKPPQGYPDLKLQSWCGIFTNYVMKKAGVPIGPWGSFKPLTFVGTRAAGKVPPGSICNCLGALNHFSIVIQDNGSTVTTVDGNALMGGISVNSTPKSKIRGFYVLPQK